MSRLGRLRERLHRRKRNREHKRKLHQGHRARREARAIQKLRKLIRRALAPRTMYDSTTVSEIPRTARAAAGYIGGSWPTFEDGELQRRTPLARHLSIAVSSRYNADCLDVETGDATPADAPGWVKRQKARGLKRPVVYGSASAMPQILQALHDAGIERHEVRIWTAHYGAGKHRCGPHSCRYLLTTTADATQFTDTALGRTLDESVLDFGFFD